MNQEQEQNKPYDPNEGTLETIKARPVTLKAGYKFFNNNPLFRLLSRTFIILIKIFIETYARLFMGFRVKNKQYYKQVKKEGFVVVGSHIHPIDTFLIGTTLFSKKTYVLMRESNLGLPFFIGRFMRISGGVPLPTKRELFVDLLKQLPEQLNKKRAIVIMPETALIMYHVGIRRFAKGAFRIAVNTNSTILPSVFIYKKPRGLMKFLRKKPYFQLHFLEPIKIESKGTNHETIMYYEQLTHQMMSDYFNAHSEVTQN